MDFIYSRWKNKIFKTINLSTNIMIFKQNNFLDRRKLYLKIREKKKIKGKLIINYL